MEPITYYHLQKSNRVLAGYFRFLLPLLDIRFEDYLDVQDIILYLEACVYKLDKAAEEMQGKGSIDWDIVTKHCQNIKEFLESNKLVFTQEKQFYEFIDIETKLLFCEKPTQEDLDRVWYLRSVDLRLIHDVLCKLFNKTLDDHMVEILDTILGYSELVMDIEDYEKDYKRKEFNNWRMYEKAYGKEGIHKVMEKLEKTKERTKFLAAKLPKEKEEFILKYADTWWDRIESFKKSYPDVTVYFDEIKSKC